MKLQKNTESTEVSTGMSNTQKALIAGGAIVAIGIGYSMMKGKGKSKKVKNYLINNFSI